MTTSEQARHAAEEIRGPRNGAAPGLHDRDITDTAEIVERAIDAATRELRERLEMLEAKLKSLCVEWDDDALDARQKGDDESSTASGQYYGQAIAYQNCSVELTTALAAFDEGKGK